MIFNNKNNASVCPYLSPITLGSTHPKKISRHISSTTYRANSWIKKNESLPLLKITQGLLSLLPLHSHSPGDEGEESQIIWQQQKRNIVNCWHDALDQRKQFL